MLFRRYFRFLSSEQMKNIALMHKRVRTALLSAPFLVTTSCTVYTPVRGMEAAPDPTLRLRLSDKGRCRSRAKDWSPGAVAGGNASAGDRFVDGGLSPSRRSGRSRAGHLRLSRDYIPAQDIESRRRARRRCRGVSWRPGDIASAFLWPKGRRSLRGSGGKTAPGGK